MNISGIGTAAITGCTSTPSCTGQTAIYSFSVPVSLDPTLPTLPFVVIGTVDFPPPVDGFTGIGAIGTSALLGYDLRKPLGPISGIGGVGYAQSSLLHTTLGDLVFASNILPTAQGTFTATTVPEPSSLLLLGMGLAVFAGARFRHAAKIERLR